MSDDAGAGGDSDAAAADDVDVPDQLLRSALEYAISVAAASAKTRSGLHFPAELRRFLRLHKLPPAALASVRVAVRGDHEFRHHLGSVVTDEVVDPIGVLWLARPDGWQQAIADLMPGDAAEEIAAMRRQERRRQAAQEAAARAHAELLGVQSELDRQRAATRDALAEAGRLRAEVDELRSRLREAQRAEHAGAQRLAKVEAALREAQHAAAPLEPPQAPVTPPVDISELWTLFDAASGAAAELTEKLQKLGGALPSAPSANSGVATESKLQRRQRVPLRLPGGVLADTSEAAGFLLRSPGVQTFIDGYNVAKLGWPHLGLDQQREQCVAAAENLAKRWKLTLTVVFDGADVEGAHARTRRGVRVVYSPAGVSADDVIRAEVNDTDPDQPVVVVTNDRAVLADVRAAGASTISSDVFLTL